MVRDDDFVTGVILAILPPSYHAIKPWQPSQLHISNIMATITLSHQVKPCRGHFITPPCHHANNAISPSRHYTSKAIPSHTVSIPKRSKGKTGQFHSFTGVTSRFHVNPMSPALRESRSFYSITTILLSPLLSLALPLPCSELYLNAC